MPTHPHLDHYEPEGRCGDTYSANSNNGGYGGLDTGSTTARRTTNAAVSGKGVSPKQLQRLDVLLRRQDNRECFDCGAKQPRWASTNLGIFFCLRCAGIHRSMGTHISKVKSVNMDVWSEPILLVMEHIGNTRGRLLYEYNMPPSARVTTTTDTAVLERAIRSKYERRLYFHPRFTELFEEFMETPSEEVGGHVVKSSAPSPGLNASLRQIDVLEQPPQQQQQQPQPPQQHTVLEELWCAPVSSGNTNSSSQQVSQGKTGSYTNVAELFSGAHRSRDTGVSSAAIGYTASPQPVAWGSVVVPPSSVPPASSTETLGWLGGQFSGTASNAHSSVSSGVYAGAPLPNESHSLSSPLTVRSTVDHLFTDGNASAKAGSSGSAKEEILSLFGSAPVAGAGGQSKNGSKANTAGHPAAWQPQMVKPYYGPS
ncbi:hypothetical protein JKF63_03600 [Porcisia hertigi]|uniref:Arf-GAP domain-containing protein n=1 Tax=Porcisia hertigi TaxID=2761500 RepID=A0A836HWV2_9TRYP|nr:hypothetical protein JKF63_03600 [Porcisia hertigi]